MPFMQKGNFISYVSPFSSSTEDVPEVSYYFYYLVHEGSSYIVKRKFTSIIRVSRRQCRVAKTDAGLMSDHALICIQLQTAFNTRQIVFKTNDFGSSDSGT